MQNIGYCLRLLTMSSSWHGPMSEIRQTCRISTKDKHSFSKSFPKIIDIAFMQIFENGQKDIKHVRIQPAINYHIVLQTLAAIFCEKVLQGSQMLHRPFADIKTKFLNFQSQTKQGRRKYVKPHLSRKYLSNNDENHPGSLLHSSNIYSYFDVCFTSAQILWKLLQASAC